MGGTLARLIDQGHQVDIAYQTSGNIAVSNEDAIKFIEVTQRSICKKDDQLKDLTLLKEIKKRHSQPK